MGRGDSVFPIFPAPPLGARGGQPPPDGNFHIRGRRPRRQPAELSPPRAKQPCSPPWQTSRSPNRGPSKSYAVLLHLTCSPIRVVDVRNHGRMLVFVLTRSVLPPAAAVKAPARRDELGVDAQMGR